MNQALKHQFIQNLRDPYFGVVTRGQCLTSPDSESFTQFWGQLALMFHSRGKHAKVVHATSAGVEDEDTEQQLSHNYRKRQHKINAQATESTTVKAKMNKALQENKNLKGLFNLEKMVEAMIKAVSAMTVKEHPKTSQGAQYKGTSNYVGRQQQLQLACGFNGTLEPNTTCYYCKDTRHMKDNCIQPNNKLAHEIQAQDR